MRSVWRAFLGALLVVCLAATASAQNGLERFEKDIKPQLELKKFTYADARPLGTSGFILNNVVAVVPASEATNDKETTVKIEKLTVDELDFDRLKKNSKDDASPRFAKLKIEGMTGDDELFSSLEPYGVPKVPVDLALDYRIDPAAKVLTLNTLEINLRGQAKINLALVMDGISDKSDMGSAKDDGRLRSASLTLDDKELLAKLVPAFAKEEGSTAGELVRRRPGCVGRLRTDADRRNAEGARCRLLVPARLEGAEGAAGRGVEAYQDCRPRRSRQDRRAERAQHDLRLHRDLSRDAGRRGEGRLEGEVTCSAAP